MNQSTAAGSAEMSKADTLRGFVTDRLSAAAREILAVVERTVAAYEEEASGFRQEIDRQRRQLELLQPQVPVGNDGLQTSRNQGSAEEEEGEEDESHEHPRSPESAGPTRSPEPLCRSARRKCGRTQINKTQTTLNLNVRVLEDPNIRVLSINAMKKCPMVTVKCPPGLQQDDFLDLLRAAVPQLARDGGPFDFLASDQRRRLQPLILKRLTPEEIHGNMKATGVGRPTLYVRLKRLTEAQEEIQPLQAESSSCDASTCEETKQQTSPHQEDEGNTSGLQRSLSAEDDEGASLQSEEDSAAGSDSDASNREEDALDSDGSWKPDGKRSDSKLSKITKKRRRKRSDVSGDNAAAFPCKVCGAALGSEALLVKHAWSHEQEAGSACGVCGVCGESVEALADHFQNRHRSDECHVCGESFLSALSLNEHVAAHSGDKPYACEVCGSSFALKASLEDHGRLHAPGHTCPTCRQVFRLELQLKAHRRTHSRAFLCGVCGKLLCDKRSLSRHKMTHSGERPHGCKVCGRGFKLPSTLKQHEKIHTKRERSYLCDVCCKMFLSSKELAIHMRTHTDEKPFGCDECGRGFTTKSQLSMHLRVHTGERPYGCPYCGRAFKRKCNLNDHVATHTGTKPHVCGICGKRCARKTYLTVHMRTHNGERPYRCSLCDRAFTQSHCLKTHMKSHHAAPFALKLT